MCLTGGRQQARTEESREEKGAGADGEEISAVRGAPSRRPQTVPPTQSSIPRRAPDVGAPGVCSSRQLCALRSTQYEYRQKKSVRGRVSRLRSRCAGSAGRTRGEAVWPAGAADAAPLEEGNGREGQSDRFPSRAPVCSSSSVAAPGPAGCGEAVMPFSARRSLSC